MTGKANGTQPPSKSSIQGLRLRRLCRLLYDVVKALSLSSHKHITPVSPSPPLPVRWYVPLDRCLSRDGEHHAVTLEAGHVACAGETHSIDQGTAWICLKAVMRIACVLVSLLILAKTPSKARGQ